MTLEREGKAELEENLEGITMKARAAWDDDWAYNERGQNTVTWSRN